MINREASKQPWAQRRIAITGASGTLGMALSKAIRAKGGFVIGLTHKSNYNENNTSDEGPQQWVHWECGKEKELEELFKTIDVLVLNHGINPGGNLDSEGLNLALEINALSNWRLIENFEKIIFNEKENTTQKEIWVNTSEAEIQPAFSPSYEISKRLIGQLVSFKYNSLTQIEKSKLKIRKIILGPFRSKLNPIGIMNVQWVASQVICQASLGFKLIIVTPNPITYFVMPITEIFRGLYFRIFENK
ncbi:SDR family oxidoreductase [Prochlorococcus marinus]|nr:SDR family oxidoreductase [Prochlorococcus marinus]